MSGTSRRLGLKTCGLLAVVFVTLMLACLGFTYWQFVYPSVVTPTAPVPETAELMSHDLDAAIQAYWYVDKYVVKGSHQEVVNFYKGLGAWCHQEKEPRPDLVMGNYSMSCQGGTSPFGNFYAIIGSNDTQDNLQTYLVIEVRWTVYF